MKWVTSKISVSVWELGSEVIKLSNWIIFFMFTLEELRFYFYYLANWMDN